MLPRQHVTCFGINGTLLGTVATAADLADLFIVPANSNIKVTGASMKFTTGGTGTGATTSPKWGIGHSLAGTGASTIFGTLLFGTRADSTYANFSLTTTDVPAGNVIRLTSIAGTTGGASQIGGYVALEYKEDWD
jgi:hypothetical protein